MPIVWIIEVLRFCCGFNFGRFRRTLYGIMRSAFPAVGSNKICRVYKCGSTFCVIAVIVVLGGCRSTRTLLPDEVAACEAVFLPWWTQLSEQDRKSIRAVYFSDMRKVGVAFPESFFQKFRGSIPPVLRTSQFKGQRRDREDWFWSFTGLSFVDPDTVQVHGGYFCGSLCARFCDYRIQRQKDGSWKIVAASNCIVS